jgi:hypothetical protein
MAASGAILWPCGVLRPQNVAWNISPRTLAAPTSVSGLTQVVSTDAGIWKATFDSIIVQGRDAVLTYRAIAVRLEGRMSPVLVPRCAAWGPRPAGSSGSDLREQVPHSDDALFSDDTGYVGRANFIYAAAPAAARAVSINVTIAFGGTLEPGQDFSIGERMYRIRTVTYTGANTATLTFRPPLREAVTTGSTLEFDEPVCRMRLATDDAMDLDLALHRFGSPTVMFLEDI